MTSTAGTGAGHGRTDGSEHAVEQTILTDGQVNIRVDDDEGVRCVTLDRPHKLNAMTEPMYDRLTEVLIDAALSESISCVVLTGAGRAFSTGRDMRAMTAPPRTHDGRRHGSVSCIEELVQFPKPLICAVNGMAVGFGATMPLHCDLVIASTEARFRFPFVELGLAGESASSVTLPIRVGYQQAARLLLTCDWVDAAEAVSLGLVLKAVAPENLMPEALDLARRVARMPADAVQATKKLLLAGKIGAVRSAFAREVESYAQLLGGPANRAAIEAFANLRQAKSSSGG
jgi:enoyl-CoA hydratase/carnithine racemase